VKSIIRLLFDARNCNLELGNVVLDDFNFPLRCLYALVKVVSRSFNFDHVHVLHPEALLAAFKLPFLELYFRPKLRLFAKSHTANPRILHLTTSALFRGFFLDLHDELQECFGSGALLKTTGTSLSKLSLWWLI
jgi:hypothetical protein